MCIDTLLRWQRSKQRRPYLTMVLQQVYRQVQNETSRKVAWHWNTIAMWLCTHSDVACSMSVKKNCRCDKWIEKIALAIQRLYHVVKTTHNAVVVAHVRRLCMLLSMGPDVSPASYLSVSSIGWLLLALSHALMCTLGSAQQLVINLLVEIMPQFLRTTREQHLYGAIILHSITKLWPFSNAEPSFGFLANFVQRYDCVDDLIVAPLLHAAHNFGGKKEGDVYHHKLEVN